MLRVRAGSGFHAAGPAIVNELSARHVLVRRTTKSPRVDMVGDGGRCSGYTGRSGTWAPCHGKHQTSRRTVCTLYACEPLTSVNGVAMVQRGYELALSRPDGQHCPEFVAFFYAHPHYSSPDGFDVAYTAACKAIRFYNSDKEKITDELKLHICGNETQNTRSCKYLGTFIDCDLKLGHL